MDKKIKGFVLIGFFTLFTSTIFLNLQASANNLDSLKEEQNEIEQKKTELNQELKDKKIEIQTNQAEQDSLLNQITNFNKEITATEDQINVFESSIEQTTQEIENLQVDIKDLEEKVNNRDELIDERLRTIQSSGTINWLDILLGANSFIDLIDRFSAASTLMEADHSLINEQNEDIRLIEIKEFDLEETLVKLESERTELLTLKTNLESQRSNKTALIVILEAEQEKLKDSKQQLENEYEEVYEISEDLEAKIIAEQKRMAELAREQERKRLEQESKQNKNNESASPNIPVTSSGVWTTPTYGTFTSGYGWRSFGGGEFHYGVDVANSTGTPIVAASDGVVSYAAPLSTYGNAVLLTHSINGKIYTTVYAHMSSIGVQAGQTVSKGQEIGKMGATGRVTGPHLHFELHNGTWAGQKVGHMNPLKFVPF
ncbi:murein hydrolase activator EnvC family protein [Ureibacillus acetophenoni]|uniref:Septal ring factor EnvC (AmiA/AmiB activator) n=1 Tax=Ureibacillus acetophenoni TaxID=614649 RepID=A0A285UMH5_9BACL|nr:peptidoglycan DD-metalloendopeptidase family protein [Ureibacillus acetophenoni]SOC43049.1 septal ring factor EnvC (AmiA/AmiB activator) [Ureibacillus acetophenoni]